MKSVRGLHVIVGGAAFKRTLERARIADAEGAAVVQLREKSIPDEEFIQRADTIRKIVANALFIVNDSADIAFACGADGVHLGQDDGSIGEARTRLGTDAIIGASTPTIALALEVERKGATYIGFGHMFPTNSKEKSSQPQTLDDLRSVIDAVNIPVIAIGGITEKNMSQILVPELAGIAVIGAIRDSSNPRETIRTLVRTLEEHHAALG